MSNEHKPMPEPGRKFFVAGLCGGMGTGIAIGAALGAALGNLALGIGTGVAIGAGLGTSMGAVRANACRRKDPQQPQ